MNLLSELAPDWPAIDALLDESLDLPSAERAGWLEALATRPGVAPTVAAAVRRLLGAPAAVETVGFLRDLPRIDLPSPGLPKAGDTLGPWQLLREVGQGGMGSVWLAERADRSLKRQVALKLPHLTWAGGLGERLARERDILATLEHPRIARLYDAGVDELGRPWLALEYVQGRPIDVYCRQEALPVPRRVSLLLQVCEAVAYAHSRLVIHRDLKPGNILVGDDGQVRLLDFGIAKLLDGERTAETALTQASGRALTLDYASPEQVRGEPLSTASDVYSLGVVAYELLAGARPYRLRRGSAAELEQAIELADIPPLSRAAGSARLQRALRGDLDAIVAKCLRKSAPERYGSVTELATDLHRHLDGLPPLAQPESGAARLARWLRRHRLEAALALAVAVMAVSGLYAQVAVGVALAGGALTALWQARRSRQLAERALDQSARADAMQRFVLDLFRVNSLHQPDPLKAQATPARVLLEQGAQRLLDGEAALSPPLRAQLLDSLFELAHPLHLTELATQLARQRVALREETLGPDDRAALDARLDLAGELLSQPEQGAELRSLLENVLAVLDQRGEHASLLRARTERLLAQTLQGRDLTRALAHSERAIALYEQVGGRNRDWAEACCERIMPLMRAERNLDAQALGEAAVAALRTLRDDDTLARALTELAETKAVLRQHDAAQGMFTEALALRERRLGPLHGSSIYLLSKFATAQRSAGRWREAESLARLGIERSIAAFGPGETHYLAMLRTERGRCLVLLGRFAEAEAELQAALVCLQAWGERQFGHAAVLLALATAQLMQGRPEEADLTARDVAALMQTLGFGPGTANQEFISLLRADIAVALGDADAAAAALAEVTPDTDAPGASMRVKGQRLAALQAEVALLRGDVRGALALASRAVSELAAKPGVAATTPGVVAAACETQARALLAAGDGAGAATAVAQAIAVRAAVEADDSGWIAAARALQARCITSVPDRQQP
jgi:tetratricopeptide (TPR) repeat protein